MGWDGKGPRPRGGLCPLTLEAISLASVCLALLENGHRPHVQVNRRGLRCLPPLIGGTSHLRSEVVNSSRKVANLICEVFDFGLEAAAAISERANLPDEVLHFMSEAAGLGCQVADLGTYRRLNSFATMWPIAVAASPPTHEPTAPTTPMRSGIFAERCLDRKRFLRRELWGRAVLEKRFVGKAVLEKGEEEEKARQGKYRENITIHREGLLAGSPIREIKGRATVNSKT